VAVVSALALVAWLAVLLRGVWMVTHPVRRPTTVTAHS